MYRLTISDIGKFASFANAVDTDWITIILADAGCIFVEDSNETFAVLQLVSSRSESEKDCIFRIQKDLLKAILLEGFLEVEVQNDSIHFTMMGTQGEMRTLDTERHQAFTTAFKDKFDVIRSGSGNSFSAATLKPMISVARVLRSFVEVEDGAAGVMSRDCTMLFKEVAGIPDLCLSAQAATSLFNCNSTWYQSKNYVYTLDGSFGLLVAQSRGSGLDDYKLLKSEDTGAAVRLHVNFEDLLKLTNKVQCDSVVYDFRNGICKVDKGTTRYGTSVEQEDVRISEKYSKNEVVLNSSVFTNIIAKLRITEWKFSIKKHFCELEADDYTIICK